MKLNFTDEAEEGFVSVTPTVKDGLECVELVYRVLATDGVATKDYKVTVYLADV